MGNQKLKWTPEEEDALRAGISKHGTGKWKNILRDPEFANKLINRSNIDLKDKWRNLCVAPGAQGIKDKARPLRIRDDGVALSPVAPPAAAAAAAAITTPPSNASPSTSLPRIASSEAIDDTVADMKNAPRYDGMIFEALTALRDANGSDVGSIFNFIEPKHEVPPNFRRILGSRLRRLAAQNKLVKLQNFYKIPDQAGTTTTTPVPKAKETNTKPRQSSNQSPAVSQEMIEEASITAACKVVEAENKIQVAKVAVEEVDKMTKIAEESEYILEIAKEIHERCSSGEVVVLDL